MKKLACIAGALGALTVLAYGVSAQESAKVSPKVVEAFMKGTFSKLPEGWTWEARVALDETMKICSETRNNPSGDQAKAILARERGSIVFPADGKVIGDWKEGAKIAQNGRGGQFSDAPGTVSGGNCFACHQMTKKEVSYGTLGPSLLNYGKLRDYKPEEAKNTFAKIYNPNSVLACSNMPRFGHNKVLTQQQIKDAVAFLFDPESPVNK